MGDSSPLTLEQKRAKLAEALRRQESASIEAPLSYSQQRLWFVDQIQPGNPIYNINVTVRITGALRRERFEPLMQKVIERHESLRTTFVVRDGVPLQRIAMQGQANTEFLEIGALQGETVEDKITAFARAHALTEFNLAKGPLSRASIIRITDTEHVGCFTTHHIISDGWSIGVMLFELAALYANATGHVSHALPPLKIQYRDFARWQRERLDGNVAQEMQKFWAEYLRGAPQILELPTDRPRPSQVTQSGTIHRFRLSAELCESLKDYSRQHQTTIFNVLLAGFATLLYRYSDQQEMVIGVPVNGRDRSEIQTLIGYFVNIVPVRICLSGDPTFQDLVRRVRDSMLAVQPNQEIPFDRLVEALQPKRTAGRIPLVQVVYLHQSFPLPDPQISPGLDFAQIEVHPGFSRFELALRTEPDAHGIAAIFEYNTDLFDAATVVRWAEQYTKLLQYAVEHPTVAIGQIPILNDDELNRWQHRRVGSAQTGVLSPHQLRRAAVEYVPPSSPLEMQIADIWRHLLGETKVGVHDDFFESGGNSLLAMRLVTELRTQLNADVDLRQLFSKPTIATVARMLQDSGNQTVSFRRARIESAPPDAPLCLSSSQQLLYLMEQFEQEIAFNAALAINIQGPLNQQALCGSLEALLQRHSILRAAIQFKDGHPVHRILNEFTVPLEIRDFSNQPEGQPAALQWAQQTTRQRFVLSSGPLVRFALAKLNAESHVLFVAIHHLVSDGWSFAILFQDLVALYTAAVQGTASTLSTLPIQFVDYAYWQRTAPALQYDGGAQYWKENFAGELPTLGLPLDYPRGKTIAVEPDVIEISIPKVMYEQLQALGRGEGVTVYMTLMSAYLVLLHKLTQQTDIIVGSSAANRLHAETAGLIGFFAGLLPLRCDLTGDPSFVAIMQRVRTLCIEAFSQPEPRLDDVIDSFRFSNPGMMPLCQTMFTYWDFASEPLSSGNVTWALADLNIVRVSGYDLVLALRPSDSGLSGALLYRNDLFRASTVEKYRDYWLVVLQSIIDQPHRRLSEIQLLNDRDHQQIVYTWNDTESGFPENRCLHELFEAQARSTPDCPAIVAQTRCWTYRQLDEYANRVAHCLVQKGVACESVVAVLLEKGPELVGTILGILKSGAAYLPLDANWPQRRIKSLLVSGSPTVLIKSHATWPDDLNRSESQETAASLNQEAQPGPDGPLSELPTNAWITLDIEQVAQNAEGAEKVPPAQRTQPTNLAYVIFTSGSSGIPKGVMVEHRSVVNVVASFIKTYQLTSNDRVLQQASIAFDVSVNEIFPVLCSGGMLVVPSESQIGDFDQLSDLIEQHSVSIMGATPSGLTELNRRADRLHSLRLVLSGGESLAQSHIDQLQKFATVTNGYGPTEATVCATYFNLQDRDPAGGEWIPIGKPLPNYKVYVLDKNLQPVPIGLAGELYVSGVGVARGYLNDPQLTDEKFISNPFIRGLRMYKTGDEVRWRSDGNLEFIGRLDRQVKIRGQRIELGEIEAVLASHPDVIHCAVVCQRTGTSEPKIGAFAKLKPASSLVHAWRDFLRERLPPSMIPVAFVPVDEIPLTPNGKVDYQRLPQIPDISAVVRGPYVAPRNSAEQMMAQIWSSALGLERVGVTENFFELGGHSLLAAQILFRVEREFKIRLSYRAFFDAQTIAQTVEIIERQRALSVDEQIQAPEHPQAQNEGDSPISALRHWFTGRQDVSGTNQVDFHAEVHLDETIRAGTKPRVDLTQTPKAIFLTGATGFLGAYLLREFAAWHDTKIYCLVRADSQHEAIERLRSGLKKYQLDDQILLRNVVPVLGDLAKPLLGMSEATFDWLAKEVDWIYHNGAAVNFVYPYSALQAANVGGTREVLKLASMTRIKPVHFSSTLAVLVGDQAHRGTIHETDQYEYPDKMNSGYGQTKWVAERLMQLAGKRGIPVAVYRPGRITGDSRTGIWNADDLFLAGLNFILQAGAAPNLDVELDLTPVDYVAQAMVAISQKPASIGKTFHLVNQHLISWPSVVAALQAAGYELELMPFDRWKQEFIATFGEFPEDWMSWLIPSTESGQAANDLAQTMSDLKIAYDCAQTQALLDGSGIHCQPPNRELLATYFYGLAKSNLLPPPNTQRE